jgi:flagellar hook-length control protein FliK
MELLTSLPAELAAAVDAAARGTAPLLRPPDVGGTASRPTAPFELVLALLTAAPQGGAVWPPAGKDLPVAPLEPPVEIDGPIELAASAPPALAPGALVTGALPLELRMADAPPGLPQAAATLAQSLPSTGLPGPPPSLPGSEPPTVDAGAPQAPTGDFEPLAAVAAEKAPAPLEDGNPQAEIAAPKTIPSLLETVGSLERGLQRSAPELSARAPPPPAPPAAFSQHNGAAAAAVAATPWAQNAAPRVELSKTLASTVAGPESASAGAADWLPTGTAPAAATSATALPPPATPGPPVDLRSPGWHEAFANRVQWMVDAQVGEAHIRLNPPELGAVDVRISLVDDKTYVQLTTATAAARDELANSLPRLRELFTVSGLELGGASVHAGRDGQHGSNGYGYGAASTARHGSSLAPFAADHDDAPARGPRPMLGRIDVFA